MVVIEVGTRGCTNRWAHMLQGRIIRLSHQLSGQTFLDTLCVCVSLSVCLLPLSIEQVRSRSASSHSRSRTDPAPLGHATSAPPPTHITLPFSNYESGPNTRRLLSTNHPATRMHSNVMFCFLTSYLCWRLKNMLMTLVDT